MSVILPNREEVAKFGGTSLADNVRRVNARKIVVGDIDGTIRYCIVVSAPGKEFYDSEKPSDILERIGRRKEDDTASEQDLQKIIELFLNIAKDEGLERIRVGPYRNKDYGNFIPKELRWKYSTRDQISPRRIGGRENYFRFGVGRDYDEAQSAVKAVYNTFFNTPK